MSAGMQREGEMQVEKHGIGDVLPINVLSASESPENGESERKSALELVRNLPTFLGVFESSALPRLKIMCYPVSLIISDKNYYYGLYISSREIEIMDAMGCLNSIKNWRLKNFLEAHICGKKLTVTPRIVPDLVTPVSLWLSALFIYLRVTIGKKLSAQLQLFSASRKENPKILREIIHFVKKYDAF